MKKRKIAVLGAGSWGTALASVLAYNGHDVRLWARRQELADEITATACNNRFLPNISLPPFLCTADILRACNEAEFFVLAVPCQSLRKFLEENIRIFPPCPVFICASKGVEVSTLEPMSQVVRHSLGKLQPIYTVLSGPSFALDVSRHLPTAVSLGCDDERIGSEIQRIFSSDFFRVYVNTDVQGVELGGALKNIMAIAAGMSDGLNFGASARSALITRGLTEIARFGIAFRAKRDTFMGLSGMGDLVLTCTSDISRNRQVGLQLGQGKKIEQILKEMKMVAEGVKTTQAVYLLAREYGIDLPITRQVYEILYQNKDPRVALAELMQRSLKPE